MLSWTNLHTYHKIIYSFPAEKYVYCQNSDKKYVDQFGAFFFHNGLRSFSTESKLRLVPPQISDDTSFMLNNNKFFYCQLAGQMKPCPTYPDLDIVCDAEMCLFNVPMENYTYQDNYSGKHSIYSNLWNNYVNERYNAQNKLITCYMDIKPSDYINFEFRNFVKIGNQLCMLNKFYDYDVTTNKPTKVDLVTIQDISGYTYTDFPDRIDNISLDYSGMTYLDGEISTGIKITSFESISDVTFDNNQTYVILHGVRFFISGDTIYANEIERYVDEPDIDFNLNLVNKSNHTATLPIERYSVYPYPYMNLEDNGTVVTALTAGDNALEIVWERTATDDSQMGNEPAVIVTGSGQFHTPSSWICTEKMYQIGDDEYFLYRWSGQIDLDSLTAGNTITITVTDEQGWHQTKTYNVV